MWLRIIALIFSMEYVHLYTKQDYENVMTEIFNTNKYNNNVLPIRYDEQSAVLLDISFHVMGINDIDEIAEKMVTAGYLHISWMDSGLPWNKTQHNDLERIFVPQEKIWRPDIFLQNGFSKFKGLGGSFYNVEVHYTGTSHWMPFEVFESRCSLVTTYFPFDHQTCNVTFVVWSYSIYEVEIYKSKEGIIIEKEFEANSVWDITSLKHEVARETLESKITFTFNLRRKPQYYVINIILPVVLLGLLNGLVFIIPAETGEKSGYSITVFLSLAVYLTLISAILPITSEEVSVLGIYLLFQVIVGVIVLFVTTIQLRLNSRSSSIPVAGFSLKIAKIGSRKQRFSCCGKKNNNSQEISIFLSKLQHPDDISQNRDKANRHNEFYHFSQPLNDSVDNEEEYSWNDVVSATDFIAFWCFIFIYVILTVTVLIILISG